ncbi:CHAT domain-containing protein [Mycena rebaudengoi]|nr:CHAT domain-containing protein [Mycena rebaudengoi]
MTFARLKLKVFEDNDPQMDSPMFRQLVGQVAREHYNAYLRDNNIEDLNKALGLLSKVLEGLPDNTGRFDYCNLIAQMLHLRFKALRNAVNLDQSVIFYQKALSLLPTVDKSRLRACAHLAHTGLATALTTRFKAFGKMEDLQDSIAQYSLAVDIGSQSDGNFENSVSGLASALITRYERRGETADLELALTCVRISIDSLDELDTQRIPLTEVLADTLSKCFDHTGDIEQLEESIALYRAVIAVRAENHPSQPLVVGNLASAMLSRYRKLCELKDLDISISLSEMALAALHKTDSPARVTALTNLAEAWRNRFAKTGNQSDFSKSVESCQNALRNWDLSPRERTRCLLVLGQCLCESFKQKSDIRALEAGIERYREAHALVGDNDSDQHDTSLLCSTLGRLGSSLCSRFELLGERQDLDEAIDFARQNLELHPVGDSDRPLTLFACANVVIQRFHSFGLVDSLREALAFRSEGVQLCPKGHPRRASFVHDLGDGYFSLYKCHHQVDDLERALVYHVTVLSMRPEGHPDRIHSLKALSEAYSASFKEFGRMDDLETAIKHDREAVSLCLQGNAHRYLYINDLAVDLCTRFDQLSEMGDLEEAIALFLEAKQSMRASLPAQSRLDRHLAIAYLQQHDAEPEPDPALLTKGFAHFEAAFGHASAAPGEAVQTLLDWAAAARTHAQRMPLRAYSRALELLNQDAAVNATLDMQHKYLAADGAPRTVALDAAAVAIGEGELETAVELLEQGRAMLWTRLHGFRSPLERLRDADAGLAARFEDATRQLERHATAPPDTDAVDAKERALDFDRQMKTQRVLQERWDGLVGEIRRLEGFSHFLRPMPFAALQEAAQGGPVILVNVSQYRSDAIILQHDGPPTVVPLPDVTPEGMKELNARFLKARQMENPKHIIVVLRSMWNDVVQPIVAQLLKLDVPRNTRIWWCPTSFLCGLPLHAAGMYKPQEPHATLPNLYISSYTPTLSALIHARADAPPEGEPAAVQLLVVGQAGADLPAVVEEIAEVKSLGAFVNALEGVAATPARVLPALQQHAYVHFACHAAQHAEEPFQSAFKLHGGATLSVLDLVQADSAHTADFAFLSACETATGDGATPDEAIHLAAAVQFAGFRSVVGTLWQMADVDGPFVAREFYGHMFWRGDGRAQFSDAAAALHGAMKALRKKEPTSVNRWINFIHVGA